MAYRVVWSLQLLKILRPFLAIHLSGLGSVAASVVKRILTTARNFSRFPFSGRIVPEAGDERIREWFAHSYRVICRIEGALVTVAAVVHG